MESLIKFLKDKEMLDIKIQELSDILSNELDIEIVDHLALELVKVIEERQNTLIAIHRANIASKISLGGSIIDVATAVIIKKSLNEKIKHITNLINNKNNYLDKLELMKQRDRYYEDLKLIIIALSKNDLNVTIGDRR